MGFINEPKEHRTVDRERNAVLTKESHDRENNFIFQLDWNGTVIRFGAQYKMKPLGDGTADVDWSVQFVDIPESADFSEEQARELISESMQEYGVYFGTKNLKEINVMFSPVF